MSCELLCMVLSKEIDEDVCYSSLRERERERTKDEMTVSRYLVLRKMLVN